MSVDSNGRINTTVNEAMAQKFRQGNHSCYAFSVEDEETTWYKISKPPKDRYDSNFKLILKEHEHIADAVIANPDVEVELQWNDEEKCAVSDFFKDYNPDWEWSLKPQCDGKFNGGYIKASQEAKNLLIQLGYTKSITTSVRGLKWIFIESEEDVFYYNDYISDGEKQFYINNGALSWDEPTQINSMEDLDNLPLAGEEDIPDTYYEQLMQEELEDKNTISIKDDNGKEQILNLQLQNQRLEKENKQLKNLCKNIQGAVELEWMKIDERTKVYEEYEDDK